MLEEEVAEKRGGLPSEFSLLSLRLPVRGTREGGPPAGARGILWFGGVESCDGKEDGEEEKAKRGESAEPLSSVEMSISPPNNLSSRSLTAPAFLGG